MDIRPGDTVRLKNINNGNIYIVLKLFKNVVGQEWATCENINTGEQPDHPVSELNKVQ